MERAAGVQPAPHRRADGVERSGGCGPSCRGSVPLHTWGKPFGYLPEDPLVEERLRITRGRQPFVRPLEYRGAQLGLGEIGIRTLASH